MMRVASAVLLMLSLTSSPLVVESQTTCKQCLRSLHPVFARCYQKCEDRSSSLIPAPDSEEVRDVCNNQCFDEVEACVNLSFCPGPVCNAREWRQTDFITDDTVNEVSSLGLFQLEYSSRWVATWDYNYGCDNDSPGLNCLGAARLYKKKNDSYILKDIFPGTIKGENYGRYLSMSKNGSVLGVGGGNKWQVFGLTDDYSCTWEETPTQVTMHTINVSPNGHYIAFGKSSSVGVNELIVREYDAASITACPWKQKGDKVTGIKYDFGAVSINNDGNMVLYGNHDVILGDGTKGKAGMYVFDDSSDKWILRSWHIRAQGGMQLNSSVKLSADGKVAAAGLPKYGIFDSRQGKVVIQEYPLGNSWYFDGPTDFASDMGNSLDISKNGKVLAVGGGGYYKTGGFVRVYKRNSQGGFDLVKNVLTSEQYGGADSKLYFGSSVSLSGNGKKMIVGAGNYEGAHAGQGAMYLFDTCNGFLQ